MVNFVLMNRDVLVWDKITLALCFVVEACLDFCSDTYVLTYLLTDHLFDANSIFINVALWNGRSGRLLPESWHISKIR